MNAASNAETQRESMLHLTMCRYARPYWNATRAFVEGIIGAPHERYAHKLIIFNTAREQVVSTEACAFIRHAVNCFYRDFAMVDTHDRTFIWQHTFMDAMHGFRNAVLAWAQGIYIFTTTRCRTNRKKQVARHTLESFATLVTFADHGYAFTLTPEFQRAIKQAEADAATRNRTRNGA